MIRLAFTLALLVVTALTAEGRLGETPHQCRQRYQQLLKTVAAFVPGSDADADMFRKEAVDITVHYKSGRAWHLTYIKLGMGVADRELFLQANAGEAGWSDRGGEHIISQTYWISQKGRRAAVSHSIGREGYMEIMTAECVEALAQARGERLRAAIREAIGLRARSRATSTPAPNTAAPAAESPKPKEDPLKGF
ncbi:MAG: hypothetical protein ACR2OZ_02975 [Verrucomicrobiales bacterium]